MVALSRSYAEVMARGLEGGQADVESPRSSIAVAVVALLGRGGYAKL